MWSPTIDNLAGLGQRFSGLWGGARMLFRRVREHVQTHNWFAVGVDLIIVVLGVFLGTQVSNLNSDRIAHEAGETYRARIVRDLENNEADLQGRIAYFRQVRAFGLQVLGDLGGARLSNEQFLVAAYQATQIYTRPMSRSAYDEVLAIGALNTLGDAPTRDSISNYYLGLEAGEVAFKTVTAYRDVVRRAIPYHVQERIRSACAEVLTANAGPGLGRLVLPESCALGLTTDELARAANLVRGTPDLEQEVTRLLADLDQKLIQAARSEARARDLSEELAALQ